MCCDDPVSSNNQTKPMGYLDPKSIRKTNSSDTTKLVGIGELDELLNDVSNLSTTYALNRWYSVVVYNNDADTLRGKVNDHGEQYWLTVDEYGAYRESGQLPTAESDVSNTDGDDTGEPNKTAEPKASTDKPATLIDDTADTTDGDDTADTTDGDDTAVPTKRATRRKSKK